MAKVPVSQDTVHNAKDISRYSHYHQLARVLVRCPALHSPRQWVFFAYVHWVVLLKLVVVVRQLHLPIPTNPSLYHIIWCKLYLHNISPLSV